MKKVLLIIIGALSLIILSLVRPVSAEPVKVLVDKNNVDQYFQFGGRATYTKSTNKINLLNNQNTSVGTAYFKERLSIKNDFKVSLNVRLSVNTTSADGFAIGFSESSIGATGENAQGFGVARLKNGTFFIIDTYKNTDDTTVPNASVRYTKEGMSSFYSSTGASLGYW